MASKSLLQQLRIKSAEASLALTKLSCAYYRDLLAQNECYIAKPPTVLRCRELSKQLFYTRLASLPSRYDAIWKEVDILKQKVRNRQHLKIEELGMAALFTAECYAWFCVGEIVGRGFTFTGYYV